jgi:hypothetical protein
VSRSYLLIFDEKAGKVRPEILDSLQEGDPKEALANTAATVFSRVMQAAQKGGVQIPGEVKEAAGGEVFSTLAEIATKVGTADFVNDQQLFDAAFMLAADTLRQMETDAGTLDPEAAKADFAQMAEMDKDGRLQQILSSLGGAA